MRFVNAVLCAMMLLFIVVQFNDPDGLLWAVLYGIPAIWAGVIAFRLRSVSSNGALLMIGLCLFGALVMTFVYWPSTPDFWKQDVWWETETAREGMGIMIATIVLLISTITIWRSRRVMGN